MNEAPILYIYNRHHFPTIEASSLIQKLGYKFLEHLKKIKKSNFNQNSKLNQILKKIRVLIYLDRHHWRHKSLLLRYSFKDKSKNTKLVVIDD